MVRWMDTESELTSPRLPHSMANAVLCLAHSDQPAHEQPAFLSAIVSTSLFPGSSLRSTSSLPLSSPPSLPPSGLLRCHVGC